MQDLEPLLDLSWEDLEELPLVVLEVDSLVQRSVKVDSVDKMNCHNTQMKFIQKKNIVFNLF